MSSAPRSSRDNSNQNRSSDSIVWTSLAILGVLILVIALMAAI